MSRLSNKVALMTVADINIEMVGRTDDVEGDQHKRASVTGFDYSDVGEILRVAGAANGITVFKHDKNSDAYFHSRSATF